MSTAGNKNEGKAGGAPLRALGALCKKNPVLLIAAAAAAITACIVPPDGQYLGYYDVKTLACLYCMLAVVCALWNINFFYVIAQRLVQLCRNTRAGILALVYVTFVGSMLIANDMALITFLPLGFFLLHITKKDHLMAYTFILQNIAANLGGMLTPFGNPQNLFLYQKFNIPAGEFMGIMLPPFLVSLLLITLLCLLIKKEPIALPEGTDSRLDPRRAVIYLALFALSIAIVFRAIPYIAGVVIITAALLLLDRRALRAVDYPLLCTFACFFTFAGNMGRIPQVRAFFSALLDKSTLLCGVLSCQVISNVPSAILLSQFTENYRALLQAVNIGGIGTIIASLASLITFREYLRHNPGKAGRYLLQFSAVNFGFLIVLTALGLYLAR